MPLSSGVFHGRELHAQGGCHRLSLDLRFLGGLREQRGPLGRPGTYIVCNSFQPGGARFHDRINDVADMAQLFRLQIDFNNCPWLDNPPGPPQHPCHSM
jgi:hypothetical protein